MTDQCCLVFKACFGQRRTCHFKEQHILFFIVSDPNSNIVCILIILRWYQQTGQQGRKPVFIYTYRHTFYIRLQTNTHSPIIGMFCNGYFLPTQGHHFTLLLYILCLTGFQTRKFQDTIDILQQIFRIFLNHFTIFHLRFRSEFFRLRQKFGKPYHHIQRSTYVMADFRLQAILSNIIRFCLHSRICRYFFSHSNLPGQITSIKIEQKH